MHTPLILYDRKDGVVIVETDEVLYYKVKRSHSSSVSFTPPSSPYPSPISVILLLLLFLFTFNFFLTFDIYISIFVKN